MEIRPHRKILRKKTKKIKVGNLFVGGDSPITVQSMTNTLTTDTKATINQINKEILTAGKVVSLSNSDFLTERLIQWAVEWKNIELKEKT